MRVADGMIVRAIQAAVHRSDTVKRRDERLSEHTCEFAGMHLQATIVSNQPHQREVRAVSHREQWRMRRRGFRWRPRQVTELSGRSVDRFGQDVNGGFWPGA